MCGIGGIVDFQKKCINKNDLIEKMMLAQKHRGPDDSGFHLGDDIVLGHRRLSIISVADGKQPIYNEDDSYVIVFNGEIYNYQDLQKELMLSGHKLATNSDTEVILHAYEEYGKSCLKKLRGMFAFAIWDKKRKEVFIARDRLGIKPLYYLNRNSIFAFSSEIKSFFISGIIDAELNLSSIDSYLTLSSVLGPETAFKGVYKLLPGHYMIINQNSQVTEKYWDINNVKVIQRNYNDSIEEFLSLFNDTLRLHMISEVPLGAFLSGGIDSSLTVGMMSKISDKPIKTFTVGYENAHDVSEIKYAKIVASHFNTEHYELILNTSKFVDTVPKVLWHLDEPITDYAPIPLLLLSELVREHVTVMLSGEGADELFAGYPIYYYMILIEKYQKLPSILRQGITDKLISSIIGGKREGKYVEWLGNNLNRRYLGCGSRFTENIKFRLYSDEMKKQLKNSHVYNDIDAYYDKVKNNQILQKMLYVDTKTWLPDYLLLKADKMTMASSLELRVPFLDHKMVEFATSLPEKIKLDGRETKSILKKVAQDILPKSIIQRKKSGFPVPMKQWLREGFGNVAREVLSEKRTKDRGYFDQKYIEKLLDKHSSGDDDLNVNIWSLYSLEMWHRLFIDGDSEISYRKKIVDNELVRKRAEK